MVRIDDQTLACPIYLYRNVEKAAAGDSAGGSGFLVGIQVDEWVFIYAVTNAHVIGEGFAVVRLNSQSGGTEIIDASAGPWFVHTTGDVAICEIEAGEEHHSKCLPESMFITGEELAFHGIGPGNEIFMVGRFVNLEGKVQNTPALRFGTVAIMPIEPMKDPRGNDALMYVIEMHSISGFSGSPVFVHILPFEGKPMFGSYGYKGGQAFGPKLLGIDCGHVRGTVENTGMSAVVRVEALQELLNRDDVGEARRKAIAQQSETI